MAIADIKNRDTLPKISQELLILIPEICLYELPYDPIDDFGGDGNPYGRVLLKL
tara:strand:+ start:98 stop:259 length:162 start_codon:yes stop_codon:yes gene_type:complete